MAEIKRSALVPYSAKKMYELVLDVGSYPHFLPWCRSTRVLESSDELQVAMVRIAGKFPQTEFTTRNVLLTDEQITMSLIEGPFRALQGSWYFTTLSPQACKVELNISFEFSRKSFATLIKPVFTPVASTIVDAFVAEAHRRHA